MFKFGIFEYDVTEPVLYYYDQGLNHGLWLKCNIVGLVIEEKKVTGVVVWPLTQTLGELKVTDAEVLRPVSMPPIAG